MDNTFDLEVNVVIRKRQPNGSWTGEQLSYAERFEMEVLDFIDVSRILGQFSHLAECVRNQRENGTEKEQS